MYNNCLGFAVEAGLGTTLWDVCGPQVVRDAKLLVKHIKLVGQGAQYVTWRLVVPW